MNYNAFFIKPSESLEDTPEIIPVSARHIVTVCQNPEKFGLTKSEIERTYKNYGEQIGFEGKARNQIILKLLSANVVRIRYATRSGTWRIQIHEQMNSSLCVSIMHFLNQIKQGTVRDLLKRSAYPYYHIEIHNTKDTSLFKGSVNEAIAFVGEQQS